MEIIKEQILLNVCYSVKELKVLEKAVSDIEVTLQNSLDREITSDYIGEVAMDKLKDMKKKSEITEDDQKNAEKKMQDQTDRFVKEIDAMIEKKQKEIMEI